MSEHLLDYLQTDNFIFPILDAPYKVYPNKLYSRETLYNNYDFQKPATYRQTLDKLVYDHYIKTGKQACSIKETLMRRLHDHSITDAIEDFLQNFNPLSTAINILSKAPFYNDKKWLSTAFEVLKKYPKSKYQSLGIPTWLYGHEPPTPFATHIAKYFANSVREDGLLTIAKGGVIFAPGSAGTIQEIFQDLTQNHYLSFGYASPMIFMDKEYWSYQRPIYPAIELMSLRGDLKNLDLGLYDTNEEVVAHIERFEGGDEKKC